MNGADVVLTVVMGVVALGIGVQGVLVVKDVLDIMRQPRWRLGGARPKDPLDNPPVWSDLPYDPLADPDFRFLYDVEGTQRVIDRIDQEIREEQNA